MKITYLGRAGFAIEKGDTLLIIDPWLGRNGAFDRAWFQFPRNHRLLDGLLDKVRGARRVGLYVSHAHEDHFCRDTPIKAAKVAAGRDRPAAAPALSGDEDKGR